MPKLKKRKKILVSTLYAYVEPANSVFARKIAKKFKIEGGYSGYVNLLLTKARKKFEKRRPDLAGN